MEETRPGQYMPVTQDDRGTYIFNSRDLCMIDHLPAMLSTGVTALKIEGRMKGIHYLATVVKTYREALDAAWAHPDDYQCLPQWKQELARINTRGYCTGFYLGPPEITPSTEIATETAEGFRFAGVVLGGSGPGRVRVAVRNRIQTGDRLEILRPLGETRSEVIEHLYDASGSPIACAQAGMTIDIRTSLATEEMDLIRVRGPQAA
jgi:putative protease